MFVIDETGNNQASITKKVFKQAAVTCIDRIGRKLLKSGWKTKGTERCSEHVCVNALFIHAHVYVCVACKCVHECIHGSMCMRVRMYSGQRLM